jgi:hypothetical protein
MGATCMAANCIGSYCFCGNEDYQGNKIFQKINTNLILEDEKLSEDSREILERCEKLLKESEEQREKIAGKFRELLIDTGACVICKPTLERAVITFIIYFFEQIMLSAKEKKVVFDKSDFAISNFITISKKSPFLTLNNDFLDNIKAKYGFDSNMIENISKGKSSLLNFLTTVFSTEAVFRNQLNIVTKLLYSQNFDNIKKIKDSIEAIGFIISYYSELTSSIFSIESQLTNPRRIELFYKIASDASEKNVRDPKILALRYSLGETSGSVENFEDNLGYKKIEILKY